MIIYNLLNKVDLFKIIRYVGLAALAISFMVWGFSSKYEDRWAVRAVLFVTIILNFVYNKFIYNREMERRKFIKQQEKQT